jgi:hypothetical protein
MQFLWVRHFDCENSQEKKKRIKKKTKMCEFAIFLDLESNFQKLNIPCKKLKKSKLEKTTIFLTNCGTSAIFLNKQLPNSNAEKKF